MITLSNLTLWCCFGVADYAQYKLGVQSLLFHLSAAILSIQAFIKINIQRLKTLFWVFENLIPGAIFCLRKRNYELNKTKFFRRTIFSVISKCVTFLIAITKFKVKHLFLPFLETPDNVFHLLQKRENLKFS